MIRWPSAAPSRLTRGSIESREAACTIRSSPGRAAGGGRCHATNPVATAPSSRTRSVDSAIFMEWRTVAACGKALGLPAEPHGATAPRPARPDATRNTVKTRRTADRCDESQARAGRAGRRRPRRIHAPAAWPVAAEVAASRAATKKRRLRASAEPSGEPGEFPRESELLAELQIHEAPNVVVDDGP